jgi:hypothetical protein
MMARPQMFLLDENMPRKILTSLRREGYSATRVYDVSLRSQPDTAIFAYARCTGYLGHPFKNRHLQTEKDPLSLLANTGGLVYNPKSSPASSWSNDTTLT